MIEVSLLTFFSKKVSDKSKFETKRKNKMKIAMIGAGKTGRGFIGRLLAEDKKEIYFIDKDASLVDALNEKKSFAVSFSAA